MAQIWQPGKRFWHWSGYPRPPTHPFLVFFDCIKWVIPLLAAHLFMPLSVLCSLSFSTLLWVSVFLAINLCRISCFCFNLMNVHFLLLKPTILTSLEVLCSRAYTKKPLAYKSVSQSLSVNLKDWVLVTFSITIARTLKDNSLIF